MQAGMIKFQAARLITIQAARDTCAERRWWGAAGYPSSWGARRRSRRALEGFV